MSLTRPQTFAALLFPTLFLSYCLPAAAQVTLQQYASSHVLTLQTVAVRQDTTLRLEEGDQTNNFAVGDKILTLTGKGLTSIDGISKLQLVDHGANVTLKDVKNLQIFLNRNELTRLPPEFFDLQNVTFIYLMQNHLGAIPPEIARMRGLQGMYFTSNGISRIPPEVYTMTWLRKLQVSKNHVTELPEAFGNLENLIHLNMSENEIHTLPESVAKLTNLRVCDFSDNGISHLPEGFGQVHIWYQLRVRNNPLTELPAGFADMPGTIDITGTKIDMNKLSPRLRARIGTEKPPKKPGTPAP